MEVVHRFRVVAWWAAGRTGIAKSSSAPNAIHFTSPPAFGGLDGRWTPEDLLLCALASCYTTTFRAVAENSKFEYTDLQVEVDGDIRKAETGYHFSEIAIRANLTISQPEEQARAIKLDPRHQTLGTRHLTLPCPAVPPSAPIPGPARSGQNPIPPSLP